MTIPRVLALLVVGFVVGAGLTYLIVDDDDSTSAARAGAGVDASAGSSSGATSGNLFVQTATSAATSEMEAESFTLTLSGVSDRVLFFAERPGHTAGSTTIADLIGSVFDQEVPPNAALVGQATDGTVALPVSLRDPAYDARARTMTYQAALLDAEQGPEGFEYGPNLRVPRQLSNAQLFIDSSLPPPESGPSGETTRPCTGAMVNNSSQELVYAGTYNSDPIQYQPSAPLFVEVGTTKTFSWAEPSTTNRIDGSIGYYVTEADGGVDIIYLDFLCTWDPDGNLFITNVECLDWTRVACSASAPNAANLTFTFTDK